MTRTITSLFLSALVFAGAAHAAPLSAAQKKVFFGSPEDKLDKKICVGTRTRATATCRDKATYVKSNEWFHHVWRPYIKGLGGGYVGIGPDQNFTLIAWARSKLAWLLDYDPYVVLLNRIHRAFIVASPDVKSYVARWSAAQRKASRALLKRVYAGRRDLRRMLGVYYVHRKTVANYFRVVQRVGRRRRSHWLHREADYRYIRKLFQEDRIRVMKGDLLKAPALTGIARVARSLGVPLRVVYLSNAEEFWRYPKVFRRTMTGLPMDGRSVVLRTRHTAKYGPRLGGKFIYIVQKGKDFQTRLKDPRTTGIWSLMKHRKPGGTGVFTIGMPAIKTAAKGRR